MDFPLYWQQAGNTYWLKTGGPIIDSALIVNGATVEFEFYDGNRWYSSKREFSSLDRAKSFAIKFGRLMRRLDRQNAVPLPKAFEEFRFSIF